MLLADMGADVIKIEDPCGGDDVRSFPLFVSGWSTYFLGLNRNKKSVTLDLKTPGGEEVLRRLIEEADVPGFPEGPPTRAGIAVTDFLAGLYANQGILLALLDRIRTGKGRHIDIALFDSLLSTLSMPVGIFEATGEIPQRVGVRRLFASGSPATPTALPVRSNHVSCRTAALPTR
jgi:crotonobetainyl-CoA:carnitine CoA-transferase CaiB-like acyl-CoA transferase